MHWSIDAIFQKNVMLGENQKLKLIKVYIINFTLVRFKIVLKNRLNRQANPFW